MKYGKTYSLFMIFICSCVFLAGQRMAAAQDEKAPPEKTGARAVEKQSEAPAPKAPEPPKEKPESPKETSRPPKEPPELPKEKTDPAQAQKFEFNGTVESVSQPVNPHETIMTLESSDGKSIELILSPATRYDPFDYYPCAGDIVRAHCATAGAFHKKTFAYVVSLVEEKQSDVKK